MLVTKYAVELCALLVSDLFGELPSRILATLLTRGRSTILQLAQNTSLSLRYIRNGLGVLIQQSLLYHSTDPETGVTSYEANCDACYALVRSGKILEVVDCQYGTAGRDLTQTLMLLGYARIADLAHAFGSRGPKINGSANGTAESGTDLIESEDHFYLVLARLIQDDIVEAVRPDSFRNSAEVYRQIESEMTKLAPGEKTTKLRPEQSKMIAEKFKTFRDQGKALKRQVAPSSVPINKKRKLANGQACVDYVATKNLAPPNPSAVVRVNHEKCLVLLRNQRLEEFAAETVGPITGQVYRVLLDILTAQLARCRPDPFLGDEANGPSPSVTSVEIYNQLDEGMILHNGIGKVPKDMTDFHCAERIKPTPLDYSSDSDDSDDAAPGTAQRTTTQITEGDSAPGNTRKERKYPISWATSGLQVKVKFEDEAASTDSRIDQMRQHLLLLAESKYRFLRHCGTSGRGQWTVDFGHVMECLREFEIDAYIEQSFGRQGLRLTRILREKGKLDEKMLPSAALMKKSDVQGKMLAMQMAGLVDVQEVPKDNSRLANRTLFFWFFDVERIQSQLLDDVYKVMLRCQQTLQAERNKERNILAFVERKDVEGREKDVMTTEHYNKYVCYLERQDKLLGQMMRLDDMVAVLRDY